MQGGSHGSAYGVKYQARCIAALTADVQRTRFLVGTLSLREENEVHLIELSGNGGDLTCEGLYPHQHEIWDLQTCPFDMMVFSTVYASGGEFGVAIWKMPERTKNATTSHLQQLASLDGHTKRIKCTLWWHGGKHGQLVSIDEETLYLWSIDASGKSAKVQAQVSAGMLHNMAGGAWDPHNVPNVATASESNVQCWDLRTMKQVQTIDHSQVRDIDFNPKKQDILITAGDDSKIRFWDRRNLGMPFYELPGHSHWTCRVCYNPKYDELVLSSGTDSMVNLWQTEAFEQGDTGLKIFDDSPRAQVDPLLRSYNGHEDSVYGIAWSAKDPCFFASLSYDGRVLVESLPQYISKRIKQETNKQ